MARIVILLIAFFAVLSPAGATAGRQDFVQFFNSIVGEWQCDLKQYDETGAVVWESAQRRVINPFLSDRFYAHEAFVVNPSSGEETRIGVQLISFDEGESAVLIDSFWSFSAGRYDVVTAEFSPDRNALAGVATRDVDGEVETRKFEFSIRQDGVVVERSYSPDDNGGEFMDHELIYSRI